MWCDLGRCSRTVVVIKQRRASAYPLTRLGPQGVIGLTALCLQAPLLLGEEKQIIIDTIKAATKDCDLESKFVIEKLKTGKPTGAALGLKSRVNYVNVRSDAVFKQNYSNEIEGIEAEVNQFISKYSDKDSNCFGFGELCRYVIHDEKCSPKQYPNGIRDEGRPRSASPVPSTIPSSHELVPKRVRHSQRRHYHCLATARSPSARAFLSATRSSSLGARMLSNSLCTHCTARRRGKRICSSLSAPVRQWPPRVAPGTCYSSAAGAG